jgi:uncharacterized protein YebE (UPF0316 family)
VDNANIIWAYGVLPVLIMLSRIVDVSFGTIRIIFVSRGERFWAAVLGFFEVLIWLVAISQIMKNLTNPVTYIAYAAGFAIGNYVGITIDRKLSMGSVMVRIITQKDSMALIDYLRTQGCGLTTVDGQGVMGPVKIIFTVVRKKDISAIMAGVQQLNPNAFYTLEDVRYAREPVAAAVSEEDNMRLRSFSSFLLKRK